ncbi:MAG: hypothetical protein GVY22_01395 [Gammaproteobacteria bacterium]|jgi:hypothetical protein|nr:hypothetical protein [Gammaproteobacteria bacterium]
MKDTVTLDDAIATASRLPLEQQEMLVEILRHRHIDARRREIAEEAQQALALFRSGQLTAQSAEDALATLQKDLDEDK